MEVAHLPRGFGRVAETGHFVDFTISLCALSTLHLVLDDAADGSESMSTTRPTMAMLRPLSRRSGSGTDTATVIGAASALPAWRTPNSYLEHWSYPTEPGSARFSTQTLCHPTL